jgi:hypothetical protein
MSGAEIARVGVWTPWAQVLCVECDYAALQGSERAKSYSRHMESIAAMPRTAEVTCPEGNMAAMCDTCHCQCWVRDDVALLQRVGFASSDLDWEGPFGWALQQTGGMCAALVFSTEGREVVVTAMDGMFLVGEYERAKDSEESWATPLHTWESMHFYRDHEMCGPDELTALVMECTRKAIAMVRNPSPVPDCA